VTAGATALGWRSVTFVTAQVTEPSRPINPDSLREYPGPAVLGITGTYEPTNSTTADQSTTATTGITAIPADPSSPVSTTIPGGAPSSHAPIAPPSTHPRSGPTRTTPPTSGNSTQTIAATGGITTVACHGNQIQLVSASPNSDFTVSVNGSGPEPNGQQLDVLYSAPKHRSEVTASCQAGRSVNSVRESPDSD
jgi:hypothetical protein